MSDAGLLARPMARHGLGVAAECNAATRSFLTTCTYEAARTLRRGSEVHATWIADALAKGSTGRARAWQRIERVMVAPPLVAEPRVRVWRYLVGRDHPFVLSRDEPGRPSSGRDVIEVRYLANGGLARGLRAGDGHWSFGVSDHAIGRIYQRSPGADPRRAVLAAHDALLSLTAGDVAVLLDAGRWTIPAGSGAFLANVAMTAAAGSGSGEPESAREIGVYVFANTYLDEEMLLPEQETQAALLRRRAPRYLDGALCPAALRAPIHMPPEALQ